MVLTTTGMSPMLLHLETAPVADLKSSVQGRMFTRRDSSGVMLPEAPESTAPEAALRPALVPGTMEAVWTIRPPMRGASGLVHLPWYFSGSQGIDSTESEPLHGALTVGV